VLNQNGESLKEEGALAVVICALYDAPSKIDGEVHVILVLPLFLPLFIIIIIIIIIVVYIHVSKDPHSVFVIAIFGSTVK